MSKVTMTANFSSGASHSVEGELTRDGNQWCCLIGDNLQDGVAGFGDNPCSAISECQMNAGLYEVIC